MGNKKAKPSTNKHPNQSFAELVSNAQLNALKPFIHQQISVLGNELARRVFGQLGNVQTRIMALERIVQNRLNITDAEIMSVVTDVEDEATGHRKVDRPAEAGDLVRISVRTKSEANPEFTQPAKQEVGSLLKQPYSLGAKELEDALVGMNVGDVKLVTIQEKYDFELTVDRVSELIAKPVQAVVPSSPVPETQTQAETSNESQNA